MRQTDDARRFDANALREKYRAERDKRLRADGLAQYVEAKGKLAHLDDDPYAPPGFTRAPLADEVEVLLVGAGFGGLVAGARLRESGASSLRLVERASDVGGTWYWNRYPGVACDIESYVYLPLLEEVGTLPTEKYARGAEIHAHCQAIARKYDLTRGACFRTEVSELRWDEADGRWLVRTNRGDAIRARFVVQSTGYLQKPKLPGIPGLETFAGPAFHTSRWDYQVTGGDAEGNLTKLRDLRVGVIGTGASAVQCVPHLAASARHLTVFQRTPSSVDVRANRPTDPAWAASLAPGWHRRRVENFQILTAGGMASEDLVADGWTDITRKLLAGMLTAAPGDLTPEEIARRAELADFAKMEEIRARADAIVKDRATAEALKPWYRQFCKRPCFHDEYLAAFNRPNVTLVDTQGRGATRITPRGVVANGREHAIDVLVFATGFEVGTDYARRSAFETIGRDGLTLSEKWRDGVRTFQGLHVHGFPNCFVMSIAQAGFTVNFPYLIDVQAQQIAHVVAAARARGARGVEATPEAEAAWVAAILERANATLEFSQSCTPGYYNNEGQASPASRQGGFYLGGPTEYADRLAAWRAEGSLTGLTLR